MEAPLRKPGLNHARQGSIALVALFGLIAVLGCLALVLDIYWVDAADVELQTASDAAALAAARQLATDDLLRAETRSERRIQSARRGAVDIAAENRCVGQPVTLDENSPDDIRFGRNVMSGTGNSRRFLETEFDPTAVFVTARRTRSRNNPVGLFLGGLTHATAADVVTNSLAQIENRIASIRPFAGAPAPLLPLAILRRVPTGGTIPSWETDIETPNGEVRSLSSTTTASVVGDEFGLDPQTGNVVRRPDGLPEITLRFMRQNGDPQQSNVQLVDVGSNLESDRLTRQIEKGWTVDDLSRFGGEISLQHEQTFASISSIPQHLISALERAIGQPRMFLLYDTLVTPDRSGLGRVTCTRVVGGRLMSVSRRGDGATELIVQPAIVTSRTAIAMERVTGDSSTGPSNVNNRYLYRVQLIDAEGSRRDGSQENEPPPLITRAE